MPLILGTNSIKDTGFNVANSLRFNSGSSDNLSKSLSTPTNDKKFTFSCWFKKSKNATEMNLFGYQPSGNAEAYIGFSTSDEIRYADRDSGDTTPEIFLVSNAKLRDVSAWYHVVVSVDTTQGTDSNRAKLYLNGEQITSLANSTYPSQNYTPEMNSSDGTKVIGADNNGNYFNGYIAETVFIDGQALDPTSFGEFDSDSPTIWKPIDVSGLTFGTNGFYLDFEDSSALGNDAAGSNNFTVNNLTAVDQSTDTCTNNFATFNPLKFSFEDSAVRDPTYSEGNLVALHHESGHKCPAFSTIAANSGKFYCEVKWLAVNGSYPVNQYTGVVNIDASVTRNWNVLGYFYRGDGTQYVVGSGSSFGATYTTNDIIGVFMDLDNNKLYFSKNGAMQNSGDPTSGSTGTGAISLAANTYYAFMTEDYNNGKTSINFGSPEFSISSGNSDPNGYGNFEYDPQGYYALNTKNLAEFG